jgi:chemotaxis protein MotB
MHLPGRIIAGAMLLPCVLGCAQSNPNMTMPWGGSASVPQRSNWFAEMQRRADEQARLAAQQRQRLEDLQRLQAQQQQQHRQLTQQHGRRNEQWADQQERIYGRYNELDRRARELDWNNRDLHAQLARSQQQMQLLQDEVDLLRQRLGESSQQLAEARRAGQVAGERLQAIQASQKRRSGATITANSSLQRDITAVMVPGMDIRQDGDLVRIALPADKLFAPGTATLHQGAQPYLDQVGDVLARHYPRQIVGIEAHTDRATATAGTLWRSQHQLTAAQAMAVFEQLTHGRGLNAQQLFVLGHGSNQPLASSGTVEGQALNRRVEIVVYPELFAG